MVIRSISVSIGNPYRWMWNFPGIVFILNKIVPYSGSDPPSILTNFMKTPVKPSFSVRVENKPNSHPVFKNTTDLYLSYRLLLPFNSSCILQHM
jgi:hypothetical protein